MRRSRRQTHRTLTIMTVFRGNDTAFVRSLTSKSVWHVECISNDELAMNRRLLTFQVHPDVGCDSQNVPSPGHSERTEPF